MSSGKRHYYNMKRAERNADMYYKWYCEEKLKTKLACMAGCVVGVCIGVGITLLAGV